MNALFENALKLYSWLSSHPQEFTWIVAVLLGFAAFCIGILLIRRDASWRFLLFRRASDSYDAFEYHQPYTSWSRSRKNYKIRFYGFGLKPNAQYYDGQWYPIEPIQATYIVPTQSNDWQSGWTLTETVSAPDFSESGYDYVVGIRHWNDVRMPRTGRRIFGLLFWLLVIGTVVLFALANRSVAVPVDLTGTSIVTTITADPIATTEATPQAAIPTEIAPVTVTIFTNQPPATNVDIWQIIGEYMPDAQMPSVEIPLPSWFRNLLSDTNMVTVTPLRGLPGYAMIMRSGDDSVVVRVTDDMVPVSYVKIHGDYFTITAGNYHWKVTWSGKLWYQPTEGEQGKMNVIINADDTMTIDWRFSLYP
jgi:hypothetical protein